MLFIIGLSIKIVLKIESCGILKPSVFEPTNLFTANSRPMSSNPPNPDDKVFIPCEICDEPVAMENYTEHTNACNSVRFMDFHGVSLDDLINPSALLVNHTNQIPAEVDFASNLASGDELESEDDEIDGQDGYEIGSEDEGPIAGEPQPNVQVVPMTDFLRALMVSINPDEIMVQPQQARNSINSLMGQLQNLITVAMQGQQQGGVGGLGNLEDVPVGLTPEQQSYCLTAKTLTEPATCNICCEDNVTQMITLICGHELCADCAKQHFTSNVKCPFCNQDLRDIINSAISDT